MDIRTGLKNRVRPTYVAVGRYFEGFFLNPRWAKFNGIRTLESLNTRKFAQIFVAMEAGEFYATHLYNKVFFDDSLDHVREMARRATSLGPGAFLEFGVATGRTIREIASVAHRQVVGFDWFEGLPEDWVVGLKTGAFSGVVPEVPENVSLEIGRIEETLPAWLRREAPSEINFVHIDTDLYKPAKIILESCAPFINDSFIVFDEFYNYPGWRDHEYKAFQEFREAHSEFEIEFTGAGSVAVSVRIVRRAAGETIPEQH